MKINTSSNGDIHIGLVLAGAVTAGAYTAGVLDYLINTLELWETEYAKDPANVPRPNVKIDTITGASAGSMAAAVTLLALATRKYQSEIKPEGIYFENNLLYKTWVEFGLKENEEITDKIFSIDDLNDSEPRSLLNTSFIDDLIEQLTGEVNKSELYDLPSYVSPDIEVLMTLSNLRGIPIDLSFANNADHAAHTMSYHKAFAHFQYNKTDASNHATMPLNLREHLKLFLDCSRASGAFPIGLKSIPFRGIPKEYIEANLKVIFGEDFSFELEEKGTYEFLAVDGGMTNNEPMAEALRILRARNQSDRAVQDFCETIEDLNVSQAEMDELLSSPAMKKLKNENPIILIDPFPNYNKPSDNEEYDIADNSLMNIIPQLYKTLRNQVLFKERDIVDLFRENSLKSMIWPTRYDEEKNLLSNPIASGALGGFAGFFDKSFRHHDYVLGMKNCQNFIRYYFSQPLADTNWTTAQHERFAFPDKNGALRVPLIPDFRIKAKEVQDGRPKFAPDLIRHPHFPPFPQVDHDAIITTKLKPLLKARLDAVVKALLKRKKKKKEAAVVFRPLYKKKKNLVTSTLSFFFPKRLAQFIARKIAVKRTVAFLSERISHEMQNHDLFKNNPHPPNTKMNKEKDAIYERGLGAQKGHKR